MVVVFENSEVTLKIFLAYRTSSFKYLLMTFNILSSCDSRGEFSLSDLIDILLPCRVRLLQNSFRQSLGAWLLGFVTLEVHFNIYIDFIYVSNHWINLSLLDVLNFCLSKVSSGCILSSMVSKRRDV